MEGVHEPQRCLAAVIENRAKEIGLAALDLQDMTLYLCQFIENGNSYTSTLMQLELYQPSEVLIVSSNRDVFASGVVRATRNYKQIGLPRGQFDDTKGLAAVDKYVCETSRTKVSTSSAPGNYLAYGAAGALLAYAVQEMQSKIRPACLQVKFMGSSKHMELDLASIRSLEIAQPLPGRGGNSLFKMLNQTKTTCGARMLRSSLLQPLTDIPTIQTRLDSIAELLELDEVLTGVSDSLSKLPKRLDALCSTLMLQQSKQQTQPAKRIASLVSSVLLLRNTLRAVQEMAELLLPTAGPLLQAVCSNFTCPVLSELLTKIEGVIDDDAHVSKTPFINKIQQCFAVKPIADSFLSLARQSFSSITEKIHDLADKYKTDYAIPSLRVSFNGKTGFHLLVKTEKDGKLPRSFLTLEKRGRNAVSCSTHELNALNVRLLDAANDCMQSTEEVLEGLVGEILQHSDLLYKLLDTIGLLDLLCSFAQFVANSPTEYSMPNMVPQGPLAIIKGRHALLDLQEDVDMEPNDTYISVCSSLNIITGPNMSGKSTYLQQVALIVILAQAGCYVPAEYASVPIFDHIFSRVGTFDSIETNSSSFMVEMTEMAHILSHVTPRSLVIIDELGRGTSTDDGVGIAWAMAEELIKVQAFTLFATHFSELKGLAATYPTCKVWQLEVGVADNTLDFRWKVKAAGVEEFVHYGLMLASTAGIPPEIIAGAHKTVQDLDEKDRVRASGGVRNCSHTLTEVYSLVHKLSCLSNHWNEADGITPDMVECFAGLKDDAALVHEALGSEQGGGLPGLVPHEAL